MPTFFCFGTAYYIYSSKAKRQSPCALGNLYTVSSEYRVHIGRPYSMHGLSD